MKKFLIVLSLFGVFTFAAPKIANACTNIVIYCADGSGYTVCCYDLEDLKAWMEIKCGSQTT